MNYNYHTMSYEVAALSEHKPVDAHGTMWWALPAWRHSAAAQSAGPDASVALLGELVEFCPQCKHERTSYGIVHCDACRAFTKLRLDAHSAADVEPL